MPEGIPDRKMKRNQEAASYGVIGLGRFGTALAITLAEAGKEVIVVRQKRKQGQTAAPVYRLCLCHRRLGHGDVKRDRTAKLRCGNCMHRREDRHQYPDHHAGGGNRSSHGDCKAISVEQGAVLEKIGAQVVYPERDMALRLGKAAGNLRTFWITVSLDNSVEILPDQGFRTAGRKNRGEYGNPPRSLG